MSIKVCVLTISDRCSQGLAEDASGRTLKELITANDQLSLCRYAIVPDDGERIKVSHTPQRSRPTESCKQMLRERCGSGQTRRGVT